MIELSIITALLFTVILIVMIWKHGVPEMALLFYYLLSKKVGFPSCYGVGRHANGMCLLDCGKGA